MHMSLSDYQSLGATLAQVMHNYLPSEQSKLQLISGRILDVFYDEFIKFIPPYILKREEEKRRMLEKAPGKLKAIGNGGTGSKFGDMAGNSSSALSAAQKRQRGQHAVGAGRPPAGADL